MTQNILDPFSIVSLLPSLLPTESKSLSSPQDGIAALLHSSLSALSFRLIAVNSSPQQANILPVNWNKDGPQHYSFKYRHEQSSMEFVINISKLGKRTVINAIALESENVASLDVSSDDFTSPSFFPHNLDATNPQPLIHGFISSNRVSDLISQFKLKIIKQLLPGLQKEGYIEESDSLTTASSSANPPMQGPTAPRPRPQTPPDAPDRNSYIPHPAFPRSPLEIGRRDLDPFPTNPFAPPSLFPPGSGDGMFVGPEHPMFGIGRGINSPNRGIWGGDGYLPPMGAPPGARFDPVGPVSPGRGSQPFGHGRQPENPDNDEFMPPGMGDMFM